MRFPFDERRATQAAAVLLRRVGERRDATWLLRVLYVADREALVGIGEPISGSTFFETELGAISKEVRDCLEGRGDGLWDEHIQRRGDSVELAKDPGDSELSDSDVAILTRCYMAVLEDLDEGRSLGPIAPEDIMRAAGIEESEIRRRAELNAHIRAVEALVLTR